MTPELFKALMAQTRGVEEARNAASAPRRVVKEDGEFWRIYNLPRRHTPTTWDVEPLSAHLRRPDSSAKLLETQAWALTELHTLVTRGVGGILGAIPVGEGKTLISLLAPVLLGAQRPLYLVPAGLKRKTHKEIPEYARDWRLHPNLRVLSNQLLQTPSSQKLLYRYMPDLMILDEAHEHKNKKSARTARLLAYCEAFPHTIVLVLSGSLTKDKLDDVSHLASIVFPRKLMPDGTAWSNSPLPHYKSRTLLDWSAVLDNKGTGDVDPGPLRWLCRDDESLQQGFGRRFTECWGVIAPKGRGNCTASLNIYGIEPVASIPNSIREAFATMQRTGKTLSGDQMTDSFSMWRRFREMSFGFYYRWLWADGVVDHEWLDIRKAYYRRVRSVLKYNRSGWDSRFHVEKAIEHNENGVANVVMKDEKIALRYGRYLTTGELQAEWRRVKVRYDPTPPKEAVWISDFILHDAAERVEKKGKDGQGLIWVEHPPVGEALSRLTGWPYFGKGVEGQGIVTHPGGPCIAQIAVHSKGHNFQDRYRGATYLCSPSENEKIEQSAGRLHRTGQEADSVELEFYMHTKPLVESFWNAHREAKWNEAMWQQPPKVLLATLDVPTDEDLAKRMLTYDPLWSNVKDNPDADDDTA